MGALTTLSGIHAFGASARPPPEQEENTGISWSNDLETTLAQAAREKKPVVVCFVAAWCPVCRQFRSQTLQSAEITALAGRSRWVMLEIDRNISLARVYEIRSTPTVYLIDPGGVTRVRISGYLSGMDFRRHFDDFERELRSRGQLPPGFSPKNVEGNELTRLTETPEGYRGSGICFSNVGYGPLRIPSQSPFQALRFGLLPRTPSTLAEGSFELGLTESWTNVWARDEGDHVVDFEMLQTSLSAAYGVSDVLDVELGFVQRSRFGGVMDGFIQNFHDAFSIDQGGRDEVPRGDFALDINGKDGQPGATLTKGDRGSFTESLLMTVQHNVTCGTETLPAFAYALTIRSELGDQEDLKNAEPIDLTASVSSSKRFGDVYGYVSVGLAWFGKEQFQGIELRTTQLSGLAALEWQFMAGASFVVQYLVSEGVAEDLGEFSDPSHEVTFGLKAEVATMTVLEIGIIENIVTSDNSPDFGLHAGLVWRF